MVRFYVEDSQGNSREVEVPTDINLSLMEVLKASDYNIAATCGGMALCATCHVSVSNENFIGQPTDAELDMIDTLPNAKENSRLACQIRITPALEGSRFLLMEAEE